MEPIPLTADQVEWWENWKFQSFSANYTFRIAMMHHSNRRSRLREKKNVWWRDFKRAHKLERDDYAVYEYNNDIVVISKQGAKERGLEEKEKW